WAAAFAEDPQGLFRKLVPIRVDRCRPGGLLRLIVQIDLVGLDAAQARHTLLDGIKGRAKPGEPPPFPGGTLTPIPGRTEPSAATPFPGVSSRAITLWQEKLDYLLEQETVLLDPDQKLLLQKQLDECRAKLQEFGGIQSASA